MIEVAHNTPRKVVIAPEILAMSFFDESSRQILEAWSRGEILPVVNRGLLAIYIRVLDRLGVSRAIIKNWVLWFTNSERAIFVNESWHSDAKPEPMCRGLAQRFGAEYVTRPAAPSTVAFPRA